MNSIIALAFAAHTQVFAGNYAPLGTPIFAQDLTCGEVQQAVSSAGTILLYYGDDLYERVNSFRRCPKGLWPENFWAPTLDNSTCYAGTICIPRGGDGLQN